MSELRVGVDLGGTKTEAVVVRLGRDPGAGAGDAERVAEEPDVVARRRIPTAPSSPDGGDDAARYARIVEETRALIVEVARDAGIAPAALPPVGVGMPGSTTTRGANGARLAVPVVKNSNTTCLNGRPFHADLSRAVGQRVAFANDANCFALAEAMWGAARDARVAFGVIMGTGVGGGVVVRDGLSPGGAPRAWEGAQGVAGEWGHVALDPADGPPCYCGRRGCIETLLSGPAMTAAYRARTAAADAGAGARSLEDIAALAKGGDGAARALFAERMELFGRALATVVNVLDPDVVVLGGGVSNLDALYTDGKAALARWVFTDHLETRLVKHALGDSAGVLGAALLPG